MGYDFTPRNKAAGDYQLGAFTWPFMLDAGLGLVLGTGEGFRPAEFVYISRPDGKCVQHNDGARVSAVEAKELAKVARWIADIQDARISQWEKIPAEDRARMEADKKRDIMGSVYKLPWAPDVVKRFREFADWSEKSGGFRID